MIHEPALNPLLGLTRASTARSFGAREAGILASSAKYAWIGAELSTAVGWGSLLARSAAVLRLVSGWSPAPAPGQPR